MPLLTSPSYKSAPSCQIFNVLVTMYATLYDPRPSVARDSLRGWLSYASPTVVNVLIGDAIFIHFVIDGLRIDTLINRNLVAPHAKTQLAMNRLWTVDPDLWLVFRMQLGAKIIVLSLMFSSAIPLLHGVVTFYCFTAVLTDKHLLFNKLKQPPRADSLRVMYAMSCWLFPLAVTFRLCFAIWVYLGLSCACEGAGTPEADLAVRSALGIVNGTDETEAAFQIGEYAAALFQSAMASRRYGQLVVLAGSLMLLLPALFLLAREGVFLFAIHQRKAHARINRVPNWPALLKETPLAPCVAWCGGVGDGGGSGNGGSSGDGSNAKGGGDGSKLPRLRAVARQLASVLSPTAEEERRPPTLQELGHLESAHGLAREQSFLPSLVPGQALSRVGGGGGGPAAGMKRAESLARGVSLQRRGGACVERAGLARGHSVLPRSRSIAPRSLPRCDEVARGSTGSAGSRGSRGSRGSPDASRATLRPATSAAAQAQATREVMYLPPLTKHLLALLAVNNQVESRSAMRRRRQLLKLQAELQAAADAAKAADVGAVEQIGDFIGGLARTFTMKPESIPLVRTLTVARGHLLRREESRAPPTAGAAPGDVLLSLSTVGGDGDSIAGSVTASTNSAPQESARSRDSGVRSFVSGNL